MIRVALFDIAAIERRGDKKKYRRPGERANSRKMLKGTQDAPNESYFFRTFLSVDTFRRKTLGLFHLLGVE